MAKTLAKQNKEYIKALAKCDQVVKDLKSEPNDEELLELKEEAFAIASLLRIKIKRNEAIAKDLPKPAPVNTTPVDTDDDDDSTSDGDLL
jgi:hypothetical protein